MWEALELAQAKLFVKKKRWLGPEVAHEARTDWVVNANYYYACIARKFEIFDIWRFFLCFWISKTDRILTKKNCRTDSNIWQNQADCLPNLISTIMDADQILVLDNGKVVDKAPIKELLPRMKVYQEIQLSKRN